MAGTETQIDALLSSLSIENLKGWRSMKATKDKQQKRYASLLRLKAFQGWKFTENEKYLRGKDSLEVHRAKVRKRVVEGRAREFREIMEGGEGDEGQKRYLDREKLNRKNVRAILNHFKRPFGNPDMQCRTTFPAVLCSSSPIQDHVSIQPRARNQYIEKRMETLLRCPNLSKAAIMKLNTSEVSSAESFSHFSVSTSIFEGTLKKKIRRKGRLKRTANAQSSVLIYSQLVRDL